MFIFKIFDKLKIYFLFCSKFFFIFIKSNNAKDNKYFKLRFKKIIFLGKKNERWDKIVILIKLFRKKKLKHLKLKI